MTRDDKIYANLRKCIFYVEAIPVLDCHVDVNDVRANPETIKEGAEKTTPRNVKDLRK